MGQGADAGDSDKCGPNAVLHPAALRAELDRVHERGYSLNLRRRRPAICAIGAAILDSQGPWEIIYAECFDRIVATLLNMEEDQTFVMQSGKPVGVFAGQTSARSDLFDDRIPPGRRRKSP
jgi:hypothetical protein